MIADLCGRGISILVTILAVKFTIAYLGIERFGVWMTVLSLAGLLTFLDFGVGNTLVNEVARAAAAEKKQELTKTISSGIGVMFLVAIFIAAILLPLVAMLPLDILFKVDQTALFHEIRIGMLVFSLLFALTIFGNGVRRAFRGLQQEYEVHALGVIGSIFSLGLLWYAADMKSGIPILIVVSMIGPILSNFILLYILWKRGLFDFMFLFERSQIHSLKFFQSAGHFLLLQFGMIACWGVDSLLISSTIGAFFVTQYSITKRLYQVVLMPLAIINGAYWPAIASADIAGNRFFISRLIRNLFALIVMVGLPFCMGIYFFGERIIQLWTNNTVYIPQVYFGIYAIWSFCEMIFTTLSMLMNGVGLIKEQSMAMISLIIIALPLKYYSLIYFGLDGMLIIFTTFFIINSTIWFGLMYRRNLMNKFLRNI